MPPCSSGVARAMDRMPFPFIQIHPDDMAELGVAAGDLVEVWNDSGSTQAMVQPEPTAKRKATFMLFGYIKGVHGDVVTSWVDRNVVPYYKGAWANLRKATAGAYKSTVSFKSRRYAF